MDFYLTTNASTFPCFQINWILVTIYIGNEQIELFIRVFSWLE